MQQVASPDRPVPPLSAAIVVTLAELMLFLLSNNGVERVGGWAATLFLVTAWVPPVLFASRALTGRQSVRWLPAAVVLATFGYLWLWLFQA